MEVNFLAGFTLIMGSDGSFNDSAPGEKFVTHYGITEYTYATAFHAGIPLPPFSELRQIDAQTIMDDLFWKKCGCDSLNSGDDIMVFHTSCLSGPFHAAQLAQRTAGLVGKFVDGNIGLGSIAAINNMNQKDFIDGMFNRDIAFDETLANAPIFIRGWTNGEIASRTLSYKLANIT